MSLSAEISAVITAVPGAASAGLGRGWSEEVPDTLTIPLPQRGNSHGELAAICGDSRTFCMIHVVIVISRISRSTGYPGHDRTSNP
jgi:hypothetical protein